jgi:RNA-directed DNA polymerase
VAPIRQLNRLLSGWAEYFSFGFTANAYDAVGWHVRARVRQFLFRRHKLPVSGNGRFGYSEIHGKAGVIEIRQRRLQGSPVHALS